MMQKLLQSIFDANFDNTLINDVNVIVVDNDINKSAQKTTIDLIPRFNGKYKLHYHNYPIKGLSSVRNESIEIALKLNPDFISFVDDDEYVSSEWLNELMKTILIHNADAVRGPVIAVTSNGIPEYILHWFKRESYPDNSRISTFTTGNLLLNCASLPRLNIKFDNRFNNKGCEDYYFGVQMIKKGATIYWAAKAIVYETIPRDRSTISWLIKRRYRGAVNFVYVLRIEKQYLALMKKFAISGLYLLAGLLSLIYVLFPVKNRLWGILKISEGLGALFGFLNLRNNWY